MKINKQFQLNFLKMLRLNQYVSWASEYLEMGTKFSSGDLQAVSVLLSQLASVSFCTSQAFHRLFVVFTNIEKDKNSYIEQLHILCGCQECQYMINKHFVIQLLVFDPRPLRINPLSATTTWEPGDRVFISCNINVRFEISGNL